MGMFMRNLSVHEYMEAVIGRVVSWKSLATYARGESRTGTQTRIVEGPRFAQA